MKTEQIKKMLTKKHKYGANSFTSKDFLSTGSTLLNLACSGKPNYGFIKGLYYFIVGDAASGKTFLSLTCLAEAAKNPNFDDYRFIYDGSEGGALMNIEKFFGNKVAERMETPSKKQWSSTIEEFYYHLDKAIKDSRPFIYILDSMDSLSSQEEKSKFEENQKAYEKGKAATGSYGDGKAKKNAAHLRQFLTPLRKSKSILIIINQTRDNLGFGFKKKTRSGGHALEFYSTIQMWSSIKQKIRKTVMGKPRQVGIICEIKIDRTRIAGKERTVCTPIYHSYGFDDIGACVDYLVDEKHWTENKGLIKAKEFKIKAKRDKIIRYIEKKGMEKDLQMIVGDVWNLIEQACTTKRKKRYE